MPGLRAVQLRASRIHSKFPPAGPFDATRTLAPFAWGQICFDYRLRLRYGEEPRGPRQVTACSAVAIVQCLQWVAGTVSQQWSGWRQHLIDQVIPGSGSGGSTTLLRDVFAIGSGDAAITSVSAASQPQCSAVTQLVCGLAKAGALLSALALTPLARAGDTPAMSIPASAAGTLQTAVSSGSGLPASPPADAWTASAEPRNYLLPALEIGAFQFLLNRFDNRFIGDDFAVTRD